MALLGTLEAIRLDEGRHLSVVLVGFHLPIAALQVHGRETIGMAEPI